MHLCRHRQIGQTDRLPRKELKKRDNPARWICLAILSHEDRDGQIGTNRGSQDDFPELPAFLRRVPVTRGPAPALGPPGDRLDGAAGRTHGIEEEETGEWTL